MLTSSISVRRSILLSIVFGFVYWLILLLPQQLSNGYHDFCDQIIIPCVLGFAIGCFLNSSKKMLILIYCFISIFICHFLLSVRVLVVLYPDLDIGDFIGRSIVNFTIIGSVQIFFSVLACFTTLKIMRAKGSRHDVRS